MANSNEIHEVAKIALPLVMDIYRHDIPNADETHEEMFARKSWNVARAMMELRMRYEMTH